MGFQLLLEGFQKKCVGFSWDSILLGFQKKRRGIPFGILPKQKKKRWIPNGIPSAKWAYIRPCAVPQGVRLKV